jgi:hypothetical protein
MAIFSYIILSNILFNVLVYTHIYLHTHKHRRTIEDVVITIPFSKNTASTNLSVNHGTAHFDDATKV